MCYAYPGPRCSNHAKVNLKKAKAHLEEVKADKSKTSYDIDVARSKLEKVKRDFYESPAGIAYLERKAKASTDERDAREAARDAKYYRQVRAEKLAQYNRVKGLPEDRMKWDYDDDGYAEGSDVRENSDNEPLYEVHDGAGEDYLAKNQLTELYGWTTDDNFGTEEDPIRVETPEGVTERELRSVTLYNVKPGREGEKRTVYRLDDGDRYFSTFGSREDAEASLEGELGTVLNPTTRPGLVLKEFNSKGWAKDGTNLDTGTARDKFGFDVSGKHANGTDRDDEGYDVNGVDEDGVNRDGWRMGEEGKGWNRDYTRNFYGGDRDLMGNPPPVQHPARA